MKQIRTRTASMGRGERCNHILLFSLLTGIVILAVGVSVTALLIDGNKIDIAQSGVFAHSIYGLAICISCFLTARRFSRGKLLWSGLAAALLRGTVLGLIFALPNARGSSLGRTLGITAIAWIIGGLFGARKKRDGYR